MNINFAFYFFIFIISYNSFILSYIAIPFNAYKNKKENQNEEFNINQFFENNFDSQIYAKIYVGSPKKFILVNLRMNNHGLILGYLCNNDLNCEESKYNINISSTFYGDQTKKIYYSQSQGSFFGKDAFYFYSNINMESKEEIKLNNISFIYIPKEENNKDNKICGQLGLAVSPNFYLTEQVNFIKNLKKLEYINTYDFSIYFTSDDEGILILGEEPHNYLPNLFNINNLRKSNVLIDGYSNSFWKTEFTQIYFYLGEDKQKIKEGKNAVFSIENNYIIGSKNYQKIIEEKFFKKYIDEKICYYEKINDSKYIILICNKQSSFDINLFPTLFFYHRIFNYTFELTKEELFLEKNNRYIFLVFFWDYGMNYFSLGKIFLRKYLFTFNIDSKSIGFYNVKLENEFNEKENNSLSFIYKLIGIFIILIIGIFGFFFAKKLYEQNRKRRLNEINEQYEYKSHDINNINYDNNEDKKVFLEIPLKT